MIAKTATARTRMCNSATMRRTRPWCLRVSEIQNALGDPCDEIQLPEKDPGTRLCDWLRDRLRDIDYAQSP
jgi:hypothetical protein